MTAPLEKDLLDTISAIATLVTPFLLLGLGGIGWLIQHKLQSTKSQEQAQSARIRELEDKLREDRLETYNAILKPFFLLFTSEKAFAQDPKYKTKNKDELAMSKMLSVEYRETGFRLSLVADDSVVRAYNKLMQYFYQMEKDFRPSEDKTCEWIALMGDLLLEIRKSMGNESSKLDRWEMVEWFITDTPTLKERYSSRFGI